jgi:3',5'-nucleoside bisphosphate phosphatase
MALIDLHTHSNRSDGLDSPTALVELAAKAGITVLGLADHDTTSGWDEALSAARKQRIGLVPAIEVSSHMPVAGNRRISVHLLAYLPDRNHDELNSQLANTRESRVSRARRMTERLSEDYPISWDDVVAGIQPGATVGRPALADALVRAGVVPTRSDAFESILRPSGKYYLSEDTLDTVAAVKLIGRAGGVPILAHPLTEFPAGSSRGDMPEGHFQELIAAGIAGFEVDHRLVPPAAKSWLRSLAIRHNLIVTGSSDYHGVGGKDNRLGENSTAIDQLERIINQAEGFEPLLPL